MLPNIEAKIFLSLYKMVSETVWNVFRQLITSKNGVFIPGIDLSLLIKRFMVDFSEIVHID